MRVWYSPDYRVELGAHTFPTAKWALTAERLHAEAFEEEGGFVDPGLPARELLLLAHEEVWVEKVLGGRMSLAEEMRAELPWSAALSLAHQKQVQGTLAACRDALAGGLGLHLGGGSHHAFRDHGEGFCLLNDLAAALLRLRREGRLSRACVVDLDAHQGNGTAAILAGAEGLATFSMHQGDIYPFDDPGAGRAASTVDIALPAGTSDSEYLKIVAERLGPFLDERRPELALYQAGVDGWEGDLLGSLALTAEGLAARDRAVAEACFTRGIPLAVTLGGGYSERLDATAALHARTLREAASAHGSFWD